MSLYDIIIDMKISLDFTEECKRLKVPFWQCPTVLFVVMGFVVIGAIIASYFSAKTYGFEPEVQALLALFIAFVTFVVGDIVVRSFAKVAEASYLKSQFLNILSHHLLTPLSSLKWAVNLLTADNIKISEKEKKEFFDIVRQSNENMINTVNSLLDISRLDVGKIKLTLERANPLEIVSDVVSDKKHDAETKGITLKIDSGSNLKEIDTDIARTKIVLSNLINNSIEFSKKDTEIIVSLYKDGNKIIFSVEDFGIGMSKEERKRMYKKFSRGDSVFKYQLKSFGLGLFTSKFIVDALGDELKFESEKGVGSRFWFALPIHKN